MVKISIITITFNSEKTLVDTIESVIGQNYENLEYIIIDGGSTDNTIEIIKKFDKYISYWKSEPDNGISDAFNKGLKIASGDVIGIINSDDQYCDNIFFYVNKEFNNSIDYLYGNLILQTLNGKFLKIIQPKKWKSFPYGGMPFGHPTLFIKRNIYEKYGYFNLNYKIAMDYELFVRIYKLKGLYLDKNIAKYKRGGMSDENFLVGHREVLAASLSSANSNFLRTFVEYYYRVLRTVVRKLIRR